MGFHRISTGGKNAIKVDLWVFTLCTGMYAGTVGYTGYFTGNFTSSDKSPSQTKNLF